MDKIYTFLGCVFIILIAFIITLSTLGSDKIQGNVEITLIESGCNAANTTIKGEITHRHDAYIVVKQENETIEIPYHAIRNIKRTK